jgi:type IV pilus assembly protein PilX
MSKLPDRIEHHYRYAYRQRGVVLFFALIALVVMSLAAVALIRSVDTSTMIAGNLAFKQAATATGDRGVESAITALASIETVMKAAGKSVFIDATNTFNQTATPPNGYYSSSTDPALTTNITDSANWTDANSFLLPSDPNFGGYEVRYIIQRMCRSPNQVASATNCMFSTAALDNNGKSIPLPSDVCQGSGCPGAGQTPVYRITSRTAGPGNTVSYIQAFVY